MTNDETSRLAVVETKVEALHARLGRVESRIDSVGDDVREIRDGLSKQRGFLAGSAFAFTAVWSVVVAVFGWLWKA
jgi:hypothetical protein